MNVTTTFRAGMCVAASAVLLAVLPAAAHADSDSAAARGATTVASSRPCGAVFWDVPSSVRQGDRIDANRVNIYNTVPENATLRSDMFVSDVRTDVGQAGTCVNDSGEIITETVGGAAFAVKADTVPGPHTVSLVNSRGVVVSSHQIAVTKR